MRLRKLAGKAKIGAKVLKNEGVLSFSIKSLQKIQDRSSKQLNYIEKIEINTKAKYEDIVQADFHKKRTLWTGLDKKTLRIHWLMPPPGKGSGGHHNIFRFIKFLEDAGHQCNIYLYARGGTGSVGHIWAAMGDSYPKIKAKMQWLEDGQAMEPADGIFATSWETAYPVFNSKLKARKFYFVQDFEPYFYPVGSMYALAENTYKFGFYGITAGGWLAKKLKTDYNMQADYFNFGSDNSLYSYQNSTPRKEIFFYARPYTERRGFEIGIMALDLFHRKHPKYTINMAGWDVSNYQISFPYINLKTLELHELNQLYNRCALGLVLSFTNMSLLPLELLSSGTIPVVNMGENNELVSDNKYINYSSNDPVSLAEKMSALVTKKDLPTYARKASQSVSNSAWEESGKKFIGIVEREIRSHE